VPDRVVAVNDFAAPHPAGPPLGLLVMTSHPRRRRRS
jgi:hypothetical protein